MKLYAKLYDFVLKYMSGKSKYQLLMYNCKFYTGMSFFLYTIFMIGFIKTWIPMMAIALVLIGLFFWIEEKVSKKMIETMFPEDEIDKVLDMPTIFQKFIDDINTLNQIKE